jgi:alkanesulfonate monooxygenase SsuD/methylene tetrahydromethanopterin reductase-like flavin-dependent oxidoreductase (luciferase family)
MLGFNVFAADSDEEARFLATSMQQAFVNLRSGQPTQLPAPVAGYQERLPDNARALLADVLSCSAIGSPATVDKAMRDFVQRTRPDELMLTSQMFDHGARLRSFEIAAQLLK